jgi:hypothetical protein
VQVEINCRKLEGVNPIREILKANNVDTFSKPGNLLLLVTFLKKPTHSFEVLR